jgi:hypothetical protein
LDPRLVAPPVMPWIYSDEQTLLQHCEDRFRFGRVEVGERACDSELAEGMGREKEEAREEGGERSMGRENEEVLEALLVGQRVLRVLAAGGGREASWHVAACFFEDAYAYLRRVPMRGREHACSVALGGGEGEEEGGDRGREEMPSTLNSPSTPTPPSKVPRTADDDTGRNRADP